MSGSTRDRRNELIERLWEVVEEMELAGYEEWSVVQLARDCFREARKRSEKEAGRDEYGWARAATEKQGGGDADA